MPKKPTKNTKGAINTKPSPKKAAPKKTSVDLEVQEQKARHKELSEFQGSKALIAVILVAIIAIGSLLMNLYNNRPIDLSSKKVLFVMTSHSDIKSDNPRETTGYWLSEASEAYEAFRNAGYEPVYVSPKGGLPPIDVKSLDFITYPNKKFLRNENDKLVATFKPEDIDYAKYRAIYFVGGHGAMFDLPNNEALQEITAKIYDNGGVVAAVCHGVAGIVNVELKNGKKLVYAKEVTGFTNAEEEKTGLKEVIPFMLQNELEAQGVIFRAGKDFQENVIVSGNLITGQNPQSTHKVVQKVIDILETQNYNK
ncbi:MAG: type 1 glutamine amidotransferase domain-containing protein [Alphaproteobacteria bacterium]|jgi:putative intracellular protease/amidase|nr:type 1 glutamine amidotransferase domain-containing protein [Alphaproteobacteria bacterium]